MELSGKNPTIGTEQQDMRWIHFNYAVGALAIDVVENIIALCPHVVNQPGRKLHSLTIVQLQISFKYIYN